MVRFGGRVAGARVRIRARCGLVGRDELAAVVFGVAGIVGGLVGVAIGRAVAG